MEYKVSFENTTFVQRMFVLAIVGGCEDIIL